MTHIRRATPEDLVRIAEIEVFNYRLNFYPIFQDDEFYFSHLTTANLSARYAAEPDFISRTLVYDDGAVKGFLHYEGSRVCKLFVEPVLQGSGIGAVLLDYAVATLRVTHLWALEKNDRAIAFYRRHGFLPTGKRMPEDDTEEYLLLLERNKE